MKQFENIATIVCRTSEVSDRSIL